MNPVQPPSPIGPINFRPASFAPALPAAVEIRHLDLAALPAVLTGEPTKALLLFWSGDRPVGQIFVTLPREGIAPGALVSRGMDQVAQQQPGLPSSAGLRTSVVICTRNRPACLARCLASLASQSLPVDEIIVVDNASTGPETLQIAEQAGVRYVREDRAGLDIARNAGARVAIGDIVAYTDDDVQLHRRWTEQLTAAFEPDVAAVTGLVLPIELTTQAQVIFERYWGFGRGFQRIDFGREFFAADKGQSCPVWKIGAGASMAFRRTVFEHVGYFDERLDAGAAGCSGDSEFWHRILSAGLKVRYEPAAVAFHQHRREMSELASQIFSYARGHAAALLIQHERADHYGNLKRVFVSLPQYYLRRTLKRLVAGTCDADRFLGREILGWASGIIFYYRTPRGV